MGHYGNLDQWFRRCCLNGFLGKTVFVMASFARRNYSFSFIRHLWRYSCETILNLNQCLRRRCRSKRFQFLRTFYFLDPVMTLFRWSITVCAILGKGTFLQNHLKFGPVVLEEVSFKDKITDIQTARTMR